MKYNKFNKWRAWYIWYSKETITILFHLVMMLAE